MRRFARFDWLLVVLQLLVILRLLGFPNIEAGLKFFASGYPTATAVGALVTCLIWLVAAGTGVFLVAADVRATIRHIPTPPVSLFLVLAFGCVCFTSGWMRYQQAQFHGCCGSALQARAALEGAK